MNKFASDIISSPNHRIMNDLLKYAIPIDNILHVVCVYSNPCRFRRRYILTKEFIERMLQEENVILYVCELCYKDQDQFDVTDASNPRHLQLKCYHPLWHKENMINIVVEKLLPKDWKAMSWIDSDLDFLNKNWAIDTLKVLYNYDICQLFSVSHNLDINGGILLSRESWCHYFFNTREKYKIFPHCGYAWACTRNMYERMGGLIDIGVLGSGDLYIAQSIVGITNYDSNYTDDYIKNMYELTEKTTNCKIGFVPGEVCHFYHGTIKNRKYNDRKLEIIKYKFEPSKHFYKNNDGLFIPTESFPEGLLIYIDEYFKSRNDDDL